MALSRRRPLISSSPYVLLAQSQLEPSLTLIAGMAVVVTLVPVLGIYRGGSASAKDTGHHNIGTYDLPIQHSIFPNRLDS